MKLRDLLFPPKCVRCETIINIFPKSPYTRGCDALCPDCRAEWEREKIRHCSRCGLEMPDCRCMPQVLMRSGCRELLKLTNYRPSQANIVSSVLFAIKRKANGRCEEFCAYQLTALIKARFGSNTEDLILTFMPRTGKAVTEYGYDHAEIICGKVSSFTGIPSVKLLSRRSSAKEQKKLNTAERRKNAECSFVLNCKAQVATEKTILLLDDVVTSGESMAHCTELLLSAGAERVFGICLAVTERAYSQKNEKL